jgi:hypothetical protein
MKVIAQILTLALVTASAALAESPSQVGAWSIYTSAANAADNVVMLQTVSANEYRTVNGEPASAKLDVICKNHKVAAVVLETPSSVDKRDVQYEAAVPTAKVVVAVDGIAAASEKWAVADGGHSLTPYSELAQSKLNRAWVEKISSNGSLAIRVGDSEKNDVRTPAFATTGLTEALQAAGCSR